MTNKIPPVSASTHLSELFYERETEYYGMTPYALLDRIGSIIVEEYFVALKRLHSETLPLSCPFLSETQIAAALTQWSRLVEGTIDKNFELFETYIMKNILAIPSDFPIDKFLEEEEVVGGSEGQSEDEHHFKRHAASENDLKSLQDKMDQITKRLEMATIKNKRLKGEIQLLSMQEKSLDYFETHLTCIKGLLQQYKIESFERSMSNFSKDLISLKYMVSETLSAGSNYLFAKYDSVINDTNSSSESSDTPTNPKDSQSKSAYNRILAEMEILSASQTAQQIEIRRKQISNELTEKTKISTLNDFEKFRTAIQKLSSALTN